ncbi:MAG: hypothetical protein HUU35_00695 [Armatimonadetes bacterium]|nr:hypothetical protein [Armatimonadota bacterium]
MGHPLTHPLRRWALLGMVLLGAYFSGSPRWTMFERAKRRAGLDQPSQKMQLAADGSVRYLHDDFRAEPERQAVVDGFEQPGAWWANGQQGCLRRSADGWAEGGAGEVWLPARGNLLVLQRRLQPLNLRRWQATGYATLWLRCEAPEAIASVQLCLGGGGCWRLYEPLANPASGVTNTIADEPRLPDLALRVRDRGRGRWVDFGLARGWNLLLWRLDRYQEVGLPDLAEIGQIALRLTLRPRVGASLVALDELRFQDGLQRHDNPLASRWTPPYGRPQFGVYERLSNGLRLRNVRVDQYPSNGDHARLVTQAPLPRDFALRLEFTLTNLDPERRRNGWLRVTYDFEPERDAGHQWFGAFLSLEYERLGLSAVWPAGVKGQVREEPERGCRLASKRFRARAGQRYRLDLLAVGQAAIVRIYTVDGQRVRPRATVGYVFRRPRGDQRYPLALEATGNVRVVLHEVEIIAPASRAFRAAAG